MIFVSYDFLQHVKNFQFTQKLNIFRCRGKLRFLGHKSKIYRPQTRNVCLMVLLLKIKDFQTSKIHRIFEYCQKSQISDALKKLSNLRFDTAKICDFCMLCFFKGFCFDNFEVWSFGVGIACLNCHYSYIFNVLVYCFPECIKNN